MRSAYVSVERARSDYEVAIDPERMTMQAAQTAGLRSSIRRTTKPT